jgi:hypothetical protein
MDRHLSDDDTDVWASEGTSGCALQAFDPDLDLDSDRDL